MNEGQELVEVPEAEIDLFEAFSDPLTELEEKNLKVKFDITTYEGETKCKKYIEKVGKFRIGVEKLRVSLKSEFLEKGRDVDKKAKVYQSRIAAIDAVHSVPLKALEHKRLNEVLEAQEAAKAELKAADDKRLADLQEREDKAKAKEAELQVKEDAFNAAANLVKHKQEVAEAGRIAAEEAVAKEKADAHQRENDRIAKELAEKNKLAEEEAARVANVEHCKKYNNLALDAINAHIDDPATSLRLVKAIVKGEIPNVTMNY
jgi:hypothetical protein